MARKFQVPEWYRSPRIGGVKAARAASDPRKQDLTPAPLSMGRVTVKLARHFGFCFGVEHAIEQAYKAIDENPGKRIFLLSEIIHNEEVNKDLNQRGVRFLMTTEGQPLISPDEVTPDDVVIVPAFGATIEMMRSFEARGIQLQQYNATCPFVEKVWHRAAELGRKGFSIIIHGKHFHEETKATFSHARLAGPSIVIRDMSEAERLAGSIRGTSTDAEILATFSGRYSDGFLPSRDLLRVGVVNQTTMLATETRAISEFFRQVMMERFGDGWDQHFADTRDTLCYATNENQDAVAGLLESGGDLAVVVGGYNSSNTTHLATLCRRRLPTFHVKDESEILDADRIRHFLWPEREVRVSEGWLPKEKLLEVLMTAGASCPDAVLERVVNRIGVVANGGEGM